MPKATYTDGGKSVTKTLDNQLAYHINCNTCPAAAFKARPDLKKHAGFATTKDCAVCHKLALALAPDDFDPARAASMGIVDPVMLGKWRRRDCSATFRHEGGMHPTLACTGCHDINAMNTADDRTAKVRVTSCSGCHITATTDDGGALNFELDQRRANPAFLCTKCHLAYGGAPVPATHIDAVAKAKTE